MFGVKPIIRPSTNVTSSLQILFYQSDKRGLSRSEDAKPSLLN
ncbi:hypothetical protein AM1_E0173 (plasmid) [Acaryochloris marina MBIC11017]|uniref:Uncharacterized protein n=1 Tax=Acaryochloris marina (strain MBIC 11017) TaxID=329726 RepID=A8ZPK6_ACAM1|nr:hypothetical protein AM1_E0173 [Acaryochloris marina MBIC11017]